MLNQEIKNYWKNYINKYEYIKYKEFLLKYFPWTFWEPSRKRLNYLLRYIKKKDKILDAGCGNGWATIALTRKGYDITSVDLSPISVKNLKQIASITNTKIKLIKNDLNKLPFKNFYFNKVFSFEALEHVSNLDEVINELKRVLKTNGKLILSIPNKYGSFSIYEDFLIEKLIKRGKIYRGIEEHHVHLHSITWWQKYFSNNCLRLLNTENIEYFSPILALFGRERINNLVKLDTKISDRLPKLLASGWLFALYKKQ